MTPRLYSFRRCPYAMRARLGLSVSSTSIRIREIVLRDKPAAMLDISPKGTVPVLHLPTGKVMEESLDILMWALAQKDPEGWLIPSPDEVQSLIARNDGPFKRALDRYKYPGRYPEEDATIEAQRAIGLEILTDLNDRIAKNDGQIMRPERSLADMAIFPFVRQFAHVDLEWFTAQPLPALQVWLDGHKNSALFKSIMPKYAQWAPGADEPLLATA